MPENSPTLAFIPAVVEAGEIVYGIIEAAVGVTGEAQVTQASPLSEAYGTRKTVKTKTAEDGRHVVRVSDAIQCCEDFMNSRVIPSLIAATIGGLLQGSTAPMDEYFESALHQLAECIRNKALSQAKPKHARKQKGMTRANRGRIALGAGH